MKKLFFLFLIFSFLFSCQFLETYKTSYQEIRENISERAKVFLSNIPFIKRYIKLPPPPEKLYKEAQELIEKLKAYKTEKIFKEEYENVLKIWEKAKRLYEKKYYYSAKKELKKVISLAKDLLQKIKAYKETLKKEAWQKYKEIEKRAKKIIKNKKSEEEKLKIELYLWKLRNLINLEDYKGFEEELKNPPF